MSIWYIPTLYVWYLYISASAMHLTVQEYKQQLQLCTQYYSLAKQLLHVARSTPAQWPASAVVLSKAFPSTMLARSTLVQLPASAVVLSKAFPSTMLARSTPVQ